MKLLNIFLFITLFNISLSFGQSINWPQNNAVAYYAKETLFLFKEKEVIGINNNIAFSKSSLNRGYILSANIPIKDFKSGDDDRDKEVSLLLKSINQKFIVFTSEVLSPQNLRDLKTNKFSSISGKLSIGGKEFEIRFKIRIEDEYLIGESVRNFTDFEIDPPSKGYGFIAKTQNYLGLYIRVKLENL